MRCRYCRIPLAPLRSLTYGEFCCDDHRHIFEAERAALGENTAQPGSAAGLLDLLEAVNPAPVEVEARVEAKVGVAAETSSQPAGH
jgi:hypothetical protein